MSTQSVWADAESVVADLNEEEKDTVTVNQPLL